jgi:predicted nucleotidyltransferase
VPVAADPGQMLASDPTLREAVERLRSRFRPWRIVLYGSRAWGRAAEDSDYDLLVLVDGDADVRRLGGEMAWELRDLPASFDVLVRGADWWREWCDTPFSLERRIEREGRELHAA